MLQIRRFLDWLILYNQEDHVYKILHSIACNNAFNLLRLNVKECKQHGRMDQHQTIFNFLCFLNAETVEIGLFGI